MKLHKTLRKTLLLVAVPAVLLGFAGCSHSDDTAQQPAPPTKGALPASSGGGTTSTGAKPMVAPAPP